MSRSNESSNGHRPHLLAGVLAAAILAQPVAAEAPRYTPIPISSVPVGVGLASSVKPNFLVVIDDSGSMNWEFMPGEAYGAYGTWAGLYSSSCNRIYFDPNQTYPLPPSPDDPSLTMPEPANSTNGPFPLDGFGAMSGTMPLNKFQIKPSPAYSSSVLAPGDAFWFEWTGAGTPGDACRDSFDPTDPTGGSITGRGWTKRYYKDATDEIQQRFRRWFMYYRTRLNVMKSAAGRAFVTASEGLRIGFLTVNPWSVTDPKRAVSADKYLKIDDFDSTQRTAWLKKLYALTADPVNGTPLLEALSRAGRHFAGYNDGINKGMDEDPVEASCQRNYTLLATDGYWNSDLYVHTGYDDPIGMSHKFESSMASPAEIGQQDGDVPSQPIDPTSPLDRPIPAPFSDSVTMEIHRQVQRDTAMQNDGYDDACPATVQDSDHPYFNQQIALPYPITPIPAYIRFKLRYSKIIAKRGRPKGYDDVFPPATWVPGLDIYYGAYPGSWFYFGYEGASLAPGEKSVVDLTGAEYNDILTELQRLTNGPDVEVLYKHGSNWKTKAYKRTIKNQFSKVWLDGDGYLNVCSLLDYKCPGPSDGNPRACDYGAGSNPADYSPTLRGKMGRSVDPPTVEEERRGSTSLSDVAMYYYANDLRTPARNPTNRQNPALKVYADNVPGSDPGWQKLESDAAPHQHMTTFTLGMGVSGYLNYDPDYESQSAADANNPDKDYARIKYGKQGWIPAWMDSEGRDRVDDLWHAAVNGRGTYLSAQDPDQLFTSLAKVIRAISAITAGGAAATTSSIRPSASDRSAFATTFSAGEWTGDVKRGTVNLSNGQITWDSISAADLLQSKVKAACDSRTIYLQRGGKRVDFTWDTSRCRADGTPDTAASTSALTSASGPITGSDVTFFTQNLKATRFASSTPIGKNALADGDLVNFLRGQYGKEYRTTNDSKNRWFRERTRALGDLVGSQPIHVGTPIYNYVDRGYLDEEGSGGTTVPGFKTRMKAGTRATMLYVGGNDGMLHALDPATLEEKWAMIPSLVVPDLVKLANAAYNMQHRFFVDGSPVVGDVYDPNASGATYGERWRSVLVGGLRGGGQGYYAIDVTDPVDPKPLWEFSCDTSGAKSSGQCDLGLSYGEPIITKRIEGATERWVVLVTSGYNSESGRAVLFVLDALTGEVLERIVAADSGGPVGAPDDQAGFAAISAWADDGMRKNRVEYVYGGDIRGRVWRFKITKGETGSQLLATLTDTNSPALPQAVTAAPELAFDDDTGRRMIFVPTGRLLHTSDGASPVKDSIWGLVDHSSSTPTTRTGGLVSVCTVTVSGSDRTTNCTGKDAKSRGWVLDLPVTGERINVSPIVQLGTLIFASNAPTSTDICVAKGETFLYYLDISNGGALASSPGGKIGHAVAGVLAVGLKGFGTSGGFKVTIAGSGGEQITESPPTKQGTVGGKRVSWRELVR